MFEGRTVTIIAGGPSVAKQNICKVTGPMIVINNSWELRPDADVLYFCDLQWWKDHNAKVIPGFNRNGIIASVGDVPHPRVKRMGDGGQQGLDGRPEYLRKGSNSGYQAINLAYHFGAKRIVLLGYDMKVEGEKTHWHSGHGLSSAVVSHTLTERFIPYFKTLVKPLEEAGVEVWNATPGSALGCWPYVDIGINK